MARTIRNGFLVLVYSFISFAPGIAFAQGTATFENARQLNRQEVIDLIANKTISYRITVGSQTASATNFEMMKVTFTKKEEYGGTLSAYASRSSSDGKWNITDNARLVRQYDRVSWGNKPFTVGVFENNGKYYWKIGEEFQELLKIE